MSTHQILPATVILLLTSMIFCHATPVAMDGPADVDHDVLIDGSYDEICYDLIASQNRDAGDVCVRIVNHNLEVAYQAHDGWPLLETHAWLGEDLNDLPTFRTGGPIPGHFPWNSGWLDRADAWSFTLPLADLGINDGAACDQSTWYLAAHAALEYYNAVYNMYMDEGGWADGMPIVEGKGWGMYTSFTLDCVPKTCEQTLLYATENTHPAIGQYEMVANIFAIDASAGTMLLIDDQLVPVNGNVSDIQFAPITDNFNGNAWDPGGGRFYFSDYQRRLGPAGANPLPSPLYFNDLRGNQKYAGELKAAAAGGAFHQGKYWYVGQGTDDLRVVTFLADGTVDEDVHVADLLGNSDSLDFGDIAIDTDGKAYLSATRTSDMGVFLGSFDLSTSTGLTIIQTGALWGADGTQIAFGSDGVLYGVNARTPYGLFRIDPVDGNTTWLSDMPVPFSDLATGPCAY